MGGTRWGDDYLAARRPDGVPSRREGEFVLLGYEDLGVGVDVQARSFAGWRVRDEERHVRAAVELSLEQGCAPAQREHILVHDEMVHLLLLDVRGRRHLDFARRRSLSRQFGPPSLAPATALTGRPENHPTLR